LNKQLHLIKFVLSVNNPYLIRPGVQSLLDEFCEVFEGIGTFPGTCKIHLKEDPKPMVQPPKQVSFTLQAKFKEELDRLESPEFIESDQANTMGEFSGPG